MLARTRDALAPQARIVVQSNALTWPGLLRVARLEHRGLLIVRSARRANYGHVRLGNAADVLLSHLAFPLAIAPRGMQDDADAPLERIRVGFNAPPSPKPALNSPVPIALAAGADLHVRGLVDDRVAGVPEPKTSSSPATPSRPGELAWLSERTGCRPSHRRGGPRGRHACLRDRGPARAL